MTLNDSLLDKKDFKSLSSMVQEKYSDMTYNIEDLEQLMSTIKEGMQSTNLLSQYKSSYRRISQNVPEIEDLFDHMEVNATSNKQEKILKKLKMAFEDSVEKFQKIHYQFETLTKNDKNLKKKYKDIPDQDMRESMISVSYSEAQQQYDDLPVVQVYDQEKVIEKRERDIKKIKTDAKDLNDIAEEIAVKIYDQDGKLDELNKELGKNVHDVKKANVNLAEAEIRRKKGNKKMMCLIFIIFLLLIMVIVFVLYEMGYLDGGDTVAVRRELVFRGVVTHRRRFMLRE